MTPKEKAKELVDRFWYSLSITLEQAKQCALIAVDEILKLHKKVALETLKFYQQVKQEIQAL
jgi:predicted proteasome-type protease